MSHRWFNHFSSLCLENWGKVCLTNELSHQPLSKRKLFWARKELSQLLCSSYFSLLGIMVIWGLLLKCEFGFGVFFFYSPLQRRKKSACRDINWLCSPCSRSAGGKRNPVIILSAHGLRNIWHEAAGKMKACLLTASLVLAAFTPGNKLIHSAVFCIIVDTVLIGAIRFPVSTRPSW